MGVFIVFTGLLLVTAFTLLVVLIFNPVTGIGEKMWEEGLIPIGGKSSQNFNVLSTENIALFLQRKFSTNFRD